MSTTSYTNIRSRAPCVVYKNTYSETFWNWNKTLTFCLYEWVSSLLLWTHKKNFLNTVFWNLLQNDKKYKSKCDAKFTNVLISISCMTDYNFAKLIKTPFQILLVPFFITETNKTHSISLKHMCHHSIHFGRPWYYCKKLLLCLVSLLTHNNMRKDIRIWRGFKTFCSLFKKKTG